jgi:ribosomal protein S9
MSEGMRKTSSKTKVNTRLSGKKSGEYGLKAARRAPQFSKR